MLLLLTLHFCFSLCAFAHTHVFYCVLLAFVCYWHFSDDLCASWDLFACLQLIHTFCIVFCFIYLFFCIFFVFFEKPIAITHFSHTCTFSCQCAVDQESMGVDGSRWESMGQSMTSRWESIKVDEPHKITKSQNWYKPIKT